MSYINLPVLCHGRTAVYDRYVFPEEEFEERAEIVKTIMKERGLNGLLIYSDGLSRSHVCYLTNYYSTLSWGNSLLVFPLDGQVMNITCLGSRDHDHTKKMIPESIELMCVGLSMVSNHHVAFEALKYIDEKKLGGKWGGVNLDCLYAPGYDSIIDRHPDIVDFTGEYNAVKAIKNEREMYAMSQAASISEKAVNEFMRLADEGVVETCTANEIERSCKEYGVDNISFLISAGEEDVRLHQPRPRKLKKGDILTVVVNAQFLHYNGVYAATKVVGGASEAQNELFSEAKKMWNGKLREMSETRKAFIGQKNAFCGKSGINSYTMINGIGVDMVEAPDTINTEIDLKPGMTLNINFYVEKKGVGSVLIGRTFYMAENSLVKINGQGM